MKNFWQKIETPMVTTTPMAGITDTAWRQICKMWGADVVHTEFVSADALYYESEKTLKMIAYDPMEQPVVVQLFGKRPEMYPKAAKIVEASGIAGIDINFGCPAKKVAGHGGGICMLRDMDTVKRIVEEVTKSVKIPVSVKTRIGLNKIQGKPGEGQVTIFDFIEAIKDFNISALIVHGRSYEVPFTGPVDLDALKKAGQEFKKHFPKGKYLINGSFQTVESVVSDIKYTNSDGVALSRALYGRPWLFKQIKDYIKTGTYQEIDWQTTKDTAIKHAHLLWATKGEKGFKEMRKHLLFYVKGQDNATEIRQQLVSVESPKDVEKIMKNI